MSLHPRSMSGCHRGACVRTRDVDTRTHYEPTSYPVRTGSGYRMRGGRLRAIGVRGGELLCAAKGPTSLPGLCLSHAMPCEAAMRRDGPPFPSGRCPFLGAPLSTSHAKYAPRSTVLLGALPRMLPRRWRSAHTCCWVVVPARFPTSRIATNLDKSRRSNVYFTRVGHGSV